MFVTYYVILFKKQHVIHRKFYYYLFYDVYTQSDSTISVTRLLLLNTLLLHARMNVIGRMVGENDNRKARKGKVAMCSCFTTS